MPRPFARSIPGCILTLGVRGSTNDPTISNCALQQNEALDDQARLLPGAALENRWRELS
jgi:hypothetical protein